jgi:putative flippase GtrA
MPRGRRRVAADATRFLVVGAVATFVALVIFNGLVHGFTKSSEAPLNDRPQLAYLLANLVGMVVSFRGTRDWAFRSRTIRHNDGGRTAFVAINLATMLIPMGFLLVSRNVLGLDDPVSDNISANVLGLFAGTVVRFLLLRQYVFPRSFVVAEKVPGS